VIEDGLKVTAYFGERARAGDDFLADAFTAIHARHGLQAGVVLRGAEGFGLSQHLRTDRLLSLSEDLPVISVGVDARAPAEAAMRDMAALPFDGLLTLERARVLSGRIDAVELPRALHEATKLTIYVGRGERIEGRTASVAVVDLLRRRGIDGATVLLGVDGVAHGQRRRARFLGGNAGVPAMVVAIGDGHRIAEVLPELGAMLAEPLMTLERVRVCKRDGRHLAEPERPPEPPQPGMEIWQKLTVFTGEQSRHDGRPLAGSLMRELRRAGAPGATSLRGVWGFHGDHEPHGDRLLQIRRRAPVVTVVIDTPDRIRRWFAVIDELTTETGLVTSELVPSLRAKKGQATDSRG
jgi:PII-like signaling protein